MSDISIQQAMSTKALDLVHGILEQAIGGTRAFTGATALADEYSRRYGKDVDKAIDALIRWHTCWNFTTGFVTGLGGAITLPVAIPAALMASWVIQVRMVATIAALYGHSLWDDQVRMMILMTIVGDSAKEILKDVGINVGKQMTRAAIERVPGRVLIDINSRVGFRLLTKVGEQGAVTLVKVVPVAGGVVAGLLDAGMCVSIGLASKRAFGITTP